MMTEGMIRDARLECGQASKKDLKVGQEENFAKIDNVIVRVVAK